MEHNRAVAADSSIFRLAPRALGDLLPADDDNARKPRKQPRVKRPLLPDVAEDSPATVAPVVQHYAARARHSDVENVLAHRYLPQRPARGHVRVGQRGVVHGQPVAREVRAWHLPPLSPATTTRVAQVKIRNAQIDAECIYPECVSILGVHY